MFKYLPFLFFAAIALTSCGDEFLDREPVDRIPVDNFYRTADEMQSATRAIYTGLQSQDFYGQAWGVDEMPSDDSRPSGQDGVDNFAANPNNENVLRYWRGHYRVITLANTVIEKAPEADITEELRLQLTAEARFLRAIAYFNLVRIYGGVPLITEIPSLDRDLFPARASVDETYAFLIADLENAVEFLPETNQQNRATKGAAMSYLASVHLTLQNYEKARDLSLAVINSGQYELVDSLGMLWTEPTYDNNSESVFEIQFAGCESWGTGNMRQAFFAPFNQGITKGSDGWGVLVPTNPNSDNPGGTALDAWEDGDRRRYWTLMEPGNYYPTLNPSDGGYTYPATGVGGSRANIKKYVIGGGTDVCFMSTGQNGSLMRFSEVIYIYAESMARLEGNLTQDLLALEMVNRLRERAEVAPFEILTAEDIYAERRREFMFEGKRWFDILRLPVRDALSLIRASGRTVTEERLLLPIPAVELEVNENLTQNPGYN